MNRRLAWTLLAVLVPAAFAAGYWSSLRGLASGREGERKVLYYVDPMNPGFRSDKPGTAPCGMPLEPVLAEEEPAGNRAEARLASMPPGTVNVRPDRQQLIGMRVETVDRRPVTREMRLPGRVAPDERRVYRLYSVTEGWIREISPATTGSIVKADELLASYYSQEVLGPEAAYIYALEALDRFLASGTATPEQIELNRKNVRTNRQVLLNLGMGPTQIDEVARTREAAQTVQLRSPASGFVLSRNVSLGRWFDRTTELYVIADLSRVWILADAFEHEGSYVRPGMKAEVRLAGSSASLEATVSRVLPQFDPATRTLKVRLEADNPGFVLRPEMFVDVELPVTLEATLAVPSSAVLDSGLQRIVFVDRGEGFFEPRRVETGWRFGDLVEITSGLMPGERVVVSGNFYLDSESRMRLASADTSRAESRDPVCGMKVEEERARSSGLISTHAGRTYSFCSAGCKKSFDEAPERFLSSRGGAFPGPGENSGRDHD